MAEWPLCPTRAPDDQAKLSGDERTNADRIRKLQASRHTTTYRRRTKGRRLYYQLFWRFAGPSDPLTDVTTVLMAPPIQKTQRACSRAHCRYHTSCGRVVPAKAESAWTPRAPPNIAQTNHASSRNLCICLSAQCTSRHIEELCRSLWVLLYMLWGLPSLPFESLFSCV